MEFKLYLIKEFQRLKEDENRRLSFAWDLNRTLSNLNYRIHTAMISPVTEKNSFDNSRMPRKAWRMEPRILGITNLT